MVYLLYALFLLSCIIIVVSVLLQPGKADAGALFTSSISTTAFGPRGTQSILAKITIGAAAVFMLTALLISFGVGGPRSVVEGAVSPDAAPTPVVAPSPQEGAPPAQQEGEAPTAGSSEAAPESTPPAGPGAAASPENR